MKKIALALTALTFLQAQELEVEGNLKVQGNIDASNQRVTNVGSPTDLQDAVNTEFLQDALRDDNIYEYLLYQVKIGTNNPLLNAEWILLDVGVESWSSNFTSELNTRALEGYEIHSMMNLPWITYTSTGGWAAPHTDNQSFTLFILKRPIANE